MISFCVMYLTGCTYISTSYSSSSKNIGISIPSKSLDRWIQDGEFLQEKFEGQGYTVHLTYADDDIEKQVSDIESLIEQEVDLLIIAAIDGSSLTEVLAEAKAKKIKVIAYDRLLMNTDAVSYYVSFDNYTIGTMQGQYIVDTLHLDSDQGTIYTMEIIAGDSLDNNAVLFYNGAMDILEPYINSGKIIIPSEQESFDEVSTSLWSTEIAKNRMKLILESYYAEGQQLDVVLCSNDSTALGVTSAIESHYKGNNLPIITGQDGDEKNLRNILDGKQAMTVFKAVSNEAAITLNLGISILNKERPDAALITDSGWKFTCVYDTMSYNNGKITIPSYLITPDVVTIDNYKEILIDTGYYSLDSEGYLIKQ